MSNNNHHNPQCGFAEDLISYLYGEINSAEKAEFEKHLNNCSNCDKELAGFGFVRSSIDVWREEVFSVLETPKIEIPFIEKQKIVEASAKSNNSRFWFDRLRNLFSLSPTWATATSAFAALAVLIGITIFVLNFSDSNQVLEVKSDGNINQKEVKVKPDETEPSSQPTEKNQTEPDLAFEKNPELNNREINNNSFPKNIVAEVTPKSIKTPQNTRENKKPNDKTMANTNINPRKNSKNSKSENTEVPKLTNFSEEEDDSLRLADLFDEVGSK